MSRSIHLAVAFLALAAAPVAAQPLDITVPGGARDFLPPPPPFSFYDYNTPLVTLPGERFDPAQAAIQADLAVHPKAGPVQVLYPAATAETLIRTGESFGTHWTRCQARYASYNLVTDTYDGRDGTPLPCKL